jgi:hypothetical protein
MSYEICYQTKCFVSPADGMRPAAESVLGDNYEANQTNPKTQNLI